MASRKKQKRKTKPVNAAGSGEVLAADAEPEIEEQVVSTKSAGDGWRETIQTIVYAVMIAVAVRVVLFEPFNIPSGSMYPTLYVGDYLFVSKYSYGYSKHSLPWRLVPFEGRFWDSEVERGDVIVFRIPLLNDDRPMNAEMVARSGETPPGGYTDYIKRFIGLPGDRIQVVGGILRINGEPVKRERIEDYYFEHGAKATQYIETLPNGREHRIIETSGDNGASDDTEEYLVPEGHYFVMGDNRDSSADSRAAIGMIPRENLIGRAEILFFSTDGSAALWEVWMWPFAIRYGRLFNGVD